MTKGREIGADLPAYGVRSDVLQAKGLDGEQIERREACPAVFHPKYGQSVFSQNQPNFVCTCSVYGTALGQSGGDMKCHTEGGWCDERACQEVAPW